MCLHLARAACGTCAGRKQRTRVPDEVRAHLLRSLLPNQVSCNSQRILIDGNHLPRLENVQGTPRHVAASKTHTSEPQASLDSVSHTGDEISREVISALALSVVEAVGYSIDWHL